MNVTRQYLPRHLEAVVARLLNEFRVVVITGPRQVGKSTLARAVLRERAGRYLTLDEPDTRERALADPDGLLRAEDGTTVIDEVQLAPELLRAVKSAVDRDERPGAFLLTGSANLLRMRDVGESLAGRAAYLELPPLTLSERVRASAPTPIDDAFGAASAADFAHASRGEGDVPPGALRDQLCRAVVEGGMPGTVALTTSARRSWYAAYLATFVERDLWQLGRVSDLVPFRRLYSLAMLRSAGLVNRADLAADAGLDQRTVARYLDLLDVGYQTRALTPYHANLGKRLVKMPKLFARDTGMAAHLMRVDTWGEAESAGVAGPLFESWMLGELVALDALSADASQVSFWRTSAGSEVDLVFERGSSVVGVECKSSSTVHWRDSAGLRALRDGLGERFSLGVLAYLGSDVKVVDDRICAVPAWQLVGGKELAAVSLGEEPAAGAALVAGRRAAGLRVPEVAALLGVDTAQVERWEASAYEDAPLAAVRTLAESLGVVVRLG